MLKKIIISVFLMTFLLSTSVVFAEDVFVTPNGSKYHTKVCRFIKDKADIETFEKKEVKDLGYSPCRRCFKDDAVVEEN